VRGAPGGAEGDAARLLPIVDLANYAPTGAGWVRVRVRV